MQAIQQNPELLKAVLQLGQTIKQSGVEVQEVQIEAMADMVFGASLKKLGDIDARPKEETADVAPAEAAPAETKIDSLKAYASGARKELHDVADVAGHSYEPGAETAAKVMRSVEGRMAGLEAEISAFEAKLLELETISPDKLEHDAAAVVEAEARLKAFEKRLSDVQKEREQQKELDAAQVVEEQIALHEERMEEVEQELSPFSAAKGLLKGIGEAIAGRHYTPPVQRGGQGGRGR